MQEFILGVIIYGGLGLLLISLLKNGQDERDADEAMKKIFGKDYKRK